jgi:hypothetical protein
MLLSTVGWGLAETYHRFYYLGTIGDSLTVQMDLRIEGERVTGSYFYNRVGQPLDLEGTIDQEGRVVIAEYTRPDTLLGRQLTGVFDGVLSQGPNDYGSSLSGSWSRVSGEPYPFELTKVAEYVQVSMRQSRIAALSTHPFFTDAALAPLNLRFQEETLQGQFDFFSEGQQQALAGQLYHSWWLERARDIAYASSELVSIAETIYVYTGGAHPNIGLAGYNYWLDDQGALRLKLRDLFRPASEFMAVLSDIILEALAQQEAQWVIDGSLNSFTERDLNDLFIITPQGLTFFFEPYLVGPYVQGSFTVLVPFALLQGVIRQDGPLAGL